MQLQISGVHHIALLVHDLERIAYFYTHVLRLREDRRWPNAEGTGVRSIWLWLGSQTRLILEQATDKHLKAEAESGWHMLACAIARGDRGAWIDHLAACQVPIVKQSNYTVYLEDPEHNRIGLSHWPDSIAL